MSNLQPAIPKVRSLAHRLFISAAALAAIILLIAGLMLSTLNHRNVERAFDARLKVYLLTLIADLDAFISDPSKEPGNLGDPRFNVALSGWYWQILKVDENKISENKKTPNNLKSSRSLATTRLPLSAEQTGIANISIVHDAALSASPNFPLHIIERTIDFGQEGRYIISIAADSSEVDDEKKGFDKALASTFLLLGAALAFSTILQVRFGLAPLDRIRGEISAIRRGDAEHIEGIYPPEISPIAQEINQLVDANKEIIERSRTHVGNLAHALKTPLSVLLNEAESKKTSLAIKVNEQIAIMRDQVQYYLDRARAAARAVAVGHVCEIEPVLIVFVRTFEKINRAKKIRYNYRVEGTPKFRGEKQDLEEMIGNLADNAGKWAKSKVDIIAVVDTSVHDRPRVMITIDDDGPGLTQDQRFKATQRGQRLDETKPGSGLGLSIVVDLANVYGGNFTLEHSPLGGLRAKLELPAVI
jgi:signal transduction histidine kinase